MILYDTIASYTKDNQNDTHRRQWFPGTGVRVMVGFDSLDIGEGSPGDWWWYVNELSVTDINM